VALPTAYYLANKPCNLSNKAVAVVAECIWLNVGAEVKAAQTAVYHPPYVSI